MRARRRHNPDRHLLVAHGNDIVDLRFTLALLPADAYGAVIVATDDTIPVSAPPRMAVLRVDPEGLDAAVSGWLSEWMPAESPCDGVNRVWLGPSARRSLDSEMCGHLQFTFERLDAVDIH